MNEFDVAYFLFDLPLYKTLNVDGHDNAFDALLRCTDTIHGYHPNLKEQTTYILKLSMGWGHVSHYIANGGPGTFAITCLRTGSVFLVYVFYNEAEKTFIKTGQFPSIAEFHISKIKQYDRVLSKEKLKEFTRAIGLAANGVGIGSFVYLRRIFEDLIEEAHVKAIGDAGWNEEEYGKNRMAEKIGLLAHHLPEFLVENKVLYSILSVGIHSLKEDECLKYFETVKVGIELILDEKVDAYQKAQKIIAARQKIQTLSSNVGTKQEKK